MEIELLKRVIVSNRQLVADIPVLNRSYSLDAAMNYVFTGVRQSGKTYLMYQSIQELLRQGIDIRTIVYINFDDERLIGFAPADFELLLQAHYQMDERKPVLFLDEIQNVPAWEKFARRMANEKYRVYITGSNAQMLSSEFTTVLGGRYQIVNVFPYSFNEFLSANNVVLENDWKYSDTVVNSVRRHFDTYFHNGGFPDSLAAVQKRDWLSALLQKMILGDIVARYGVKNVHALAFIVKKLSESVKQPISYTRLTRLVSSLGAKIQVNTVIDYMRYLEESWMLFGIRNFASRFVEREGNKKYYFSDNGLLNLFLIDGNTSLLENMVALSLFRKYGHDPENDRVFFYHSNVEVDFYVPEDELAVQVAYSLSNLETVEREVGALTKLTHFLPCRRRVIITYDEEGSLTDKYGAIEIVPCWKWLLNC